MNKDEITQEINELKSLLVFMETPESILSFLQLVFQKYIEFEITPKVAKYLRKNGFRLPNGNSIQSNHVSEMIRSNPKDVEQDIISVAQRIFQRNYRAVMKRHG